MKRPASAIFLALLMTSASAPGRAAENWPDSVDQYVRTVRAGMKTTDMDGYAKVVANPEGAFIIDVREDDEYRAGHVPGSVHIPRGLLEFRIWRALGYPQQVDLARRIYVQCQNGGRATLAAKQLQDVGFTNVTAVVMAFPEWVKKGLPVEK
jgi:rhodanese-related sulfurtransferase